MKREGRQHGMVRTYPILPSAWRPRPEPRHVNKFNSAPTAGLFTRVSQKPTNHSKFTGKCGRPKCRSCHIHPACKAKVKAKGTQKLRSSDRLITLRVVGLGSGPDLKKYSGFSATGMLDLLAYHDSIDHDHDHDHDDEVYNNYVSDDDDVHEGSYNVRNSSSGVEIVDMDGDDYDGHNHDDHHLVADDDNNNDNDDDEDEEEENMSYCDVGYVLDVDEDEGWCIVDEM